METFLKKMDVDNIRKENAMVILSELSTQHGKTITTFDAFGDYSELIALEIANSQSLQREERRVLRKSESTKSVFDRLTSKRVTSSQFQKIFCTHCKWNSDTGSCRQDKFPNLKPMPVQDKTISKS